MLNLINIVILIMLFFLPFGRVFARADTLKVVSNAVRELVMLPGEWGEVYRWVIADENVPDKEEVLMLIRYHYGSFDRLAELLCYLNGGKAYTYLLQFVFPRIGRYTIKPEELPVAAMQVPERILPMAYIDAGVLVPAVLMEKEGRADSSRRVIVALKNNILYDLALAPNIEVELSIGKRWSLNTEYKCPWWLNSRHDFCYQLLSGGMEARYWLGDRKMRDRLTGHFLGIYTEGGVYDFQLKEENGIRGRYYTASGLTYGYAHQLTGHLAIECSLGIGCLATGYRKYTSYKGDLVWTNGGHYHFIGPTKAKVSLVWRITAGQ